MSDKRFSYQLTSVMKPDDPRHHLHNNLPGISGKNMDLTHLHLIVSHLPVYGTILGALVLIFGMLSNSATTRKAAYMVLLISAIGGVTAFSTGESAEETVENIAGVSERLIEAHEDSAKTTLTLMIVMGALSIVALVIGNKNSKFLKPVAAVVLIATLAAFAASAYTGYLGGKIRHSEIQNPLSK